MLALQLFGSARAQASGRPLRFPDRKATALLAVLALDGTATRARLAELLWDGQGDSDARRNLRRELHRLREAGFEPWLAGEGDQLSLRPEVQVDVHGFRQALAAGDLPAALALHEAPLLQGFDLAGAPAFDEWLAARRAELAQRWRAAAEAHGATLEARGQWREALVVAGRLLQHDTLHEAHYRRAMTLHAALGEREAALALYERCRRTLGRELGLKPLPETVALADRIRSGQRPGTHTSTTAAAGPRAAATAAAAAALPALQTLPAAAPLVGREGVLRSLQRTLADGRMVVLRAAGGLGKTRVLQALAATAPQAPAGIAPQAPAGIASPAPAGIAPPAHLHETRAGDRRVPYAALARWLRAAPTLKTAVAAEPALPIWVQTELARLLPELGASGAALTSDAQRLRLFEAVREAWQRWFDGDVPALHLFDDWQFVDEASAAWWAWWREQPSAPRALLVAERPDEARPEAAAMLREAAAAAQAETVELAPLDAAAVYALVRQLSGTRDPQRFSRRLAEATGGHPFYVLETLQHLLQSGVIRVDEQGQWHTPYDEATADYRELPIAPSVQAAVMQRLAALPDATRRLLEAASLTGDDFPLGLVASASALDDWEAVRALESALGARVVARGAAAEASAALRYRFEHDLFAQAVAAALSPERRALMHRALAQHLVREGGPAIEPARVAEHFDAAGDTAAALAWHQRALARAQRRLLLRDMLAHAERVLALSPEPVAQMRAHLARAEAWRMLAQPDAADAAMREATAALAALDAGAAAPGAANSAEPLLALQVELTAAHSLHALRANRLEEALAALQPLLQRDDLAPEARARLLVCSGNVLRAQGRGADSMATLLSALAMQGDEPSIELGDLLDDLARTAAAEADFEACHRHASEAVRVHERVQHTPGLVAALTMVGVAELMLGRSEAALAPLQRARAMAAQHGFIALERGAILNLASGYLALGRRREATQVVDEGHALSGLFASPAEQQAFVEARYQCRVDAGELGAALAARDDLVRFSLGLHEVARRHSGLLVSLDLPLVLADAETAATAAKALAADMRVERHGGLRPQALAKIAWWRLVQGDAAGALAQVQQAAADGVRPEDRLYLAYATTSAHLALGDAAAARRACVADTGHASAEVRALQLASALHANTAMPEAAAPWVEQALALLQGGQVPPLNRLLLLEALQRLGAGDRAEAVALAQRLRASLAGHAWAQAGFDRQFGALLQPTAVSPGASRLA